MNLNQYQQLSSRTRNPNISIEKTRHSNVYGLVGESGEVINEVYNTLFDEDSDKLSEELGDWMWYVSQIAEDYGLVFGVVADGRIRDGKVTLRHVQEMVVEWRPDGIFLDELRVRHVFHAVAAVAAVVDRLKKHLFHGHTLDQLLLSEELCEVLWSIANIAEDYGLSLEAIAEENINKLKDRYPQGFREIDSIQRAT